MSKCRRYKGFYNSDPCSQGFTFQGQQIWTPIITTQCDRCWDVQMEKSVRICMGKEEGNPNWRVRKSFLEKATEFSSRNWRRQRRARTEIGGVEGRGCLLTSRGQRRGVRFWSAFYFILSSALFWWKYNNGESFKDLKIQDGIAEFRFRKIPTSSEAHGYWRKYQSETCWCKPDLRGPSKKLVPKIFRGYWLHWTFMTLQA